MEGRGGHYSAWPRRSDFGDTPLPYEAARNGEYISPYSAPLQGLGQLDPGTLPNEQYPASQSLFDQPQFPVPSHGFTQPLIPRESFADLEGPGSPFTTTDYHNSFNRAFISSGPVVHEGFIPAPGNEDEYWLDPDILNDRDESLLEGSDGASSEYDSGFEAQELEEIGNRNDNSEDDADFEDDVDEGEVDQDEMAVDDDEDGGDEIVRRRRKSIARGGRPVGRPRGSGIARGGRGGRQPNVEEGRSRRGRPRKTPNGRRGRPPSNAKFQRAVKTTPEYRRLIQIAHDAHFKDDHQTAIEYATQAITLDPSIFNAHQLLSEIYADMGNEFKSLQVLIIGAPAARSTELWYNLIDRVEAIDPEEYPICNKRLKTDLILECLRWIIQLDKSDYEARRMKLDAESQLPNRESKCVFLSERMLKMRPYDAHVLMTMARTGTKDAKQTRLNLRRIIDSFDTSIEYFLAEDKPATSNFNWSLLNIYLDVLSRTGNYQHCLSRLKALSRWLQNRAHETYWDRWDDDREFDEDDVPRRKEAPQFSRRPGRQPGYGKLEDFPLEMRVKLGLFRMRLGPSHLKEAMCNLDWLLREEHGPNSLVYDFTDYFQDVADALHAEGHNQEALKFYEPLFERERNQMKLRNLIGMHASYKALGKVDEAQSLIPELLAWGREGDASAQDIAIAAKFFEDNDMKEEAMKLARTLYMHRGGRFLQKVGFKGYAEVQDNLNTDRRVARVKHSTRKARDNAKMKALRATVGEVVSPMEDENAGREVSFLDSSTELPEAGLFRTTKSLHDRRTKIFLPDDIPGTSVPNDAISQVLFRKRLNKLAVDYSEELSKYRKQHRDAVASFKRLEELLEAAENGDDVSVRQWMLIAEQLVREYCLFDLFYYDRRRAFTGYFRRLGSGEIWRDSALMELAVIANNVEDGESEPEITQKSETPPEKFYGIHFDNWFDLFAQYCIFLARNGNSDGCFKVFELADQSNIFHLSQDYSHKLQICRLACALTLDDSIQASDAIRCLLRNYPFATDLFRMYSGVNRFCSAPSGFSTGPTAKALIRHIKTMDYALLTDEQREWFNFRSDDRSSSWMINKASTNAAKHVKDHDPALFALYSHVLMCSGSYMAALNYYYRAFALTPDDPIINLGIGLAYIQHGMKRLSENRQFQIQQGLSFVYRYYEIRTKDSVALNRSEAEFNMGRVWHSLGLTSLAIPAYERCIQLSQQVQAEAMSNSTDQNEGTEDFAVEAAFALQSIYALTGNLAGARRVTEEVLVIE